MSNFLNYYLLKCGFDARRVISRVNKPLTLRLCERDRELESFGSRCFMCLVRVLNPIIWIQYNATRNTTPNAAISNILLCIWLCFVASPRQSRQPNIITHSTDTYVCTQNIYLSNLSLIEEICKASIIINFGCLPHTLCHSLKVHGYDGERKRGREEGRKGR